MDTLTHALSGALLARATAPALQPGAGVGLRNRMGAGFLAAAFPDADIVLSPLSPLAYLWQHRGVTHSFLLLPLWAVLLALIFAWMSRARVGWTAYFGVCALGIAAHILGDHLHHRPVLYRHHCHRTCRQCAMAHNASARSRRTCRAGGVCGFSSAAATARSEEHTSELQ